MEHQNQPPHLNEHERHVFLHADGVIKEYQAIHEGRVPPCIKMNTDNAELLKETLRKINNLPPDNEVMQMRGSKIIIDDQLDLNDIVATELG